LNIEHPLPDTAKFFGGCVEKALPAVLFNSAIPNLNEKMAWTEHLKAAALAPAGGLEEGIDQPVSP
jgi:hypothetical protein